MTTTRHIPALAVALAVTIGSALLTPAAAERAPAVLPDPPRRRPSAGPRLRPPSS